MILITRPLESAYNTSDKVKLMGFMAKVFPLLKIEFDVPALKQLDFKRFDLVIITSQNISKTLKSFPISVENPILVVGEKNARLLKDAGFNVLAYKPTATDLLAYICEKVSPSQKLLYLSGDYIASQLDTKLLALGFNVSRKIVYSSIAVDSFPATVLNDIKQILFYSPRTAKAFTEVCQNDLSSVTAICISENTAFMLNSLKFNDILIAKFPTEDGMLSLLK